MDIYFFLIVALQGYCIYDAYRNNKAFYWYFIILLLPFFGSFAYIITQAYYKGNSAKVKEETTTVLQPSASKKIKELEAKVDFIDSYANRIDLADAYFNNNDLTKAIESYEKTLEDKVQDDLYARQKLILSYYQLKDYDKVIEQAEKIKDNSEFKGSKEQFCYGIALSKIGKTDEAEMQLIHIDRPYSNYAERLELAKFYMENNKTSEGKELLTEISTESQRFTKPNRKLFAPTIVEVERMLSTL
ncbi:hypothetical protein DFQ11_107145 [Winogradskyella epiphytica]|uniref:Cardiolipin synthase N-terminal domain-containing protein n=1 Tax=Winogradskyella epiphytica TaxID=262005 RepID=A0A2V4YAY4_9FLAO|nr:hypothetical protein [Winogradskyella epiphytica]PYE80173.1 hypothetical protein DFQ11_107145 [Winogradskyella epiphytica]GGW71806.1 hypothetical protein GCM10008085_25060 [Winogradskyella epiphytica]